MPSRTLPGKITISRYSSSNSNTDCIQIEIHDEKSGCLVMQAALSLLEYANAITNRSYCPCEITYYDAPIGKKREIKTELVPIPEKSYNLTPAQREEYARSALTPFEIDGWTARRDDIFNHHRRNSKNQAEVSFIRFVEEN